MPLHCIQWKTSSFRKLLEKDGSVTIYTRKLQTLATETFKVYKNLSPAIIADLFHVRQNNYNLRHDSYFSIPNVKSVYHGTESLSNLGPRIWNLVPFKLKQIIDIYAFKKVIKKWKPKNCPCCYVNSYVGFFWNFQFCTCFWNTFRSSPPETLWWRIFFMGERSDMVFF